MRFILPLLLTLLSAACAGSVKSSRNPASVEEASPARDAAIASIAADLAKYTRTLTRPVHVFHWANSTKLQPTVAAAIERGRSTSKYFWSSEDLRYGLVGHGIYAARDPVISSGYGNSYDLDFGILMVIRLPTGSRWIDIRNLPSFDKDGNYHGDNWKNSNRVLISNQSAALASNAGCLIQTDISIRNWWQDAACGSLLRAAFDRLKLSGNIHRWHGGQIVGCAADAVVFTIFNEALFNPNSLQVHRFGGADVATVDPKSADGIERALIYRFATEQNGKEFPEGNPRYITEGWTDPALAAHAKAIPEATYRKWLDQNIYACSGKYPEEPVGKTQLLNQDLNPFGSVVIDGATYGFNLQPIAVGNATKAASDFCNGKAECVYKVAPRFLGDILPDVAKTFKLGWKCGSAGKLETKEVAAPADGQSFTITCTEAQPIHVVSATYGGNVKAVPLGNASLAVQKICAAKQPYCSFDVKPDVLGDPGPSAGRQLRVKWHCSKRPDLSEKTEVADGAQVYLNCLK